MTQLDDFKRVLGLDENYQEDAAAPQPKKPAGRFPSPGTCIPGSAFWDYG